MIIFGRVKEILPDFIKVLVFGKSDARTAPQCLPFGIDSKPVNDLLAVYASTDNNGNAAMIGYIKKSELTEIGETRLYCTDDTNKQLFYIHLKKTENGHAELGGNDDNLVRYSELKAEYDKTALYLETLKTQTKALAVILDSIAPGTSIIFESAFAGKSIGDISSSKIFKLKTYKEEEN